MVTCSHRNRDRALGQLWSHVHIGIGIEHQVNYGHMFTQGQGYSSRSIMVTCSQRDRDRAPGQLWSHVHTGTGIFTQGQLWSHFHTGTRIEHQVNYGHMYAQGQG